MQLDGKLFRRDVIKPNEPIKSSKTNFYTTIINTIIKQHRVIKFKDLTTQ